MKKKVSRNRRTSCSSSRYRNTRSTVRRAAVAVGCCCTLLSSSSSSSNTVVVVHASSGANHPILPPPPPPLMGRQEQQQHALQRKDFTPTAASSMSNDMDHSFQNDESSVDPSPRDATKGGGGSRLEFDASPGIIPPPPRPRHTAPGEQVVVGDGSSKATSATATGTPLPPPPTAKSGDIVLDNVTSALTGTTRTIPAQKTEVGDNDQRISVLSTTGAVSSSLSTNTTTLKSQTIIPPPPPPPPRDAHPTTSRDAVVRKDTFLSGNNNIDDTERMEGDETTRSVDSKLYPKSNDHHDAMPASTEFSTVDTTTTRMRTVSSLDHDDDDNTIIVERHIDTPDIYSNPHRISTPAVSILSSQHAPGTLASRWDQDDESQHTPPQGLSPTSDPLPIVQHRQQQHHQQQQQQQHQQQVGHKLQPPNHPLPPIIDTSRSPRYGHGTTIDQQGWHSQQSSTLPESVKQQHQHQQQFQTPRQQQQQQQYPAQHQQQQQMYPQSHMIPRNVNPLQQRQVPPSVQHLQQQRRRPQAPPPPAWKMLWRRVERGLDRLADVEEVIVGRAQQLYSGVKGVSPSDILPVAPKLTSVFRRPPERPEQMDMSRFQKSIPSVLKKEPDASNRRPADGEHSAPSISMHVFGAPKPSHSLETREGVDVESRTGSSTSSTGRKIDWNNVRNGKVVPISGTTSQVMRANGGASSPPAVPTFQRDPRLASQWPAHTASLPAASTDQQRRHIHDPPETSHAGRTMNPQQPNPSAYRSPIAALNAQARENSNPTGGPPTERQTRVVYPDDDDDEPKFLDRLGRLLPPIPKLRLSFRLGKRSTSNDFAYAALDAWKADDEASLEGRGEGFFGFFRRKRKEMELPPRLPQRSEPKETLSPPLASLKQRIGKGDSLALLTASESNICQSIGRQKAFFDLLLVASIVVGIKSLPDMASLQFPQTIVEALTTFISDLISVVAAAMETWLPFAVAVAYLAIKTSLLLSAPVESSLVSNTESTIREHSFYGSLFLRLVSSISVDTSIPESMQQAARAQILSTVNVVRLQSFVIGVLACYLLSTVSIVGPLLMDLLVALQRIFALEQLRMWPPRGLDLVHGIKSSMDPFLSHVSSLVSELVREVINNPMRCASKAILVASLLAVTFIPVLEANRKHGSDADENGNTYQDQGEKELHMKFTEQVANLGSSCANRLGLISVHGQVESVLERWRFTIPQSADAQGDASLKSLVRLVGYSIVSGFLLVCPLALHRVAGLSTSDSTNMLLPQWNSYIDMSIILLFAYHLVFRTMIASIRAEDMKGKVRRFISTLKTAVEDRERLLSAPLQHHASLSPTAGIAVHDLWASHVTKRAWAIRGANLICRNGEVLLLLGDTGEGKTRLLSVLAEAILSPSRTALTAQKVRGTVSVGGLDVDKWDSRQLKTKVGISLHDVRSVNDMAQILSGLSIEEILDPCHGNRALDSSQNSLGAPERSAMMEALKMTGLSPSLLQRLPSKLSTIVTANEDDLHPSPLRPRYHMLSPTEWSKLLLARMLTQAIYDNDKASSSFAGDTVANSLLGSVLLLDDLFLYLSEADETRLMQDLRQSGAATIATSHRWAMGRFADHIAVVKDGTIIETGTHKELLTRGPQHSIYAAKWHAMTSI